MTMMLSPSSFPLDRDLPTWLGLLSRLPDGVTVRLCLHMLGGHRQPCDCELEPLVQAQALVRRGSRVIFTLRHRRNAGDRQAVIAYQSGVAVGFYGLEDKCLPVSFTPASGSAWSEAQLHQLRRGGLGHGDAVRQRQMAHRRNTRGEVSVAGPVAAPAAGSVRPAMAVSSPAP